MPNRIETVCVMVPVIRQSARFQAHLTQQAAHYAADQGWARDSAILALTVHYGAAYYVMHCCVAAVIHK